MLSVVVPCHNEAPNIPLILEAFSQARKDCPFELLIVNNASTDETAEVLEHLRRKPEFSFVRVVNEPVPGYGRAIISGLKTAEGDVLCWTHADMQTDPSDVVRGLRIFERYKNNDNIIIKGKRVKRDLQSWLFTLGMSVIASFALAGIYSDINAQPKLFSRKFFKKNIKEPPMDFSLDLYLLAAAKKNKCRIITFPVVFGKRLHGQSKWAFNFKSKIKTVLRTIKYIFKLRKKFVRST